MFEVSPGEMCDARSRAFLSASGRRELGDGCTGHSDFLFGNRVKGVGTPGGDFFAVT